MNALDKVKNFDLALFLASVATLVRARFPAASLNLSPWRDDPHTRLWFEEETIDLSFHFPGWSRRLECRSLLFQLTVSKNTDETSAQLLGVLIRGMSFDGERWRLATVGDWKVIGSHLHHSSEMESLRSICRDLFKLFPSYS